MKKREFAALHIIGEEWGVFSRLTKSFIAFGSAKAMRLLSADLNEDESA